MPYPKKDSPKKESKKSKIFYRIRTRPNYGAMAQIERIKEEANPMDLPVIRTFSRYKYAQEFVEKQGDTSNVYFINMDKWCWDNHRLWHKTAYRQVRSHPYSGTSKFVGGQRPFF